MEALVVEGPKRLAIREIDLPQDLGPYDVRIAMNNVGICGSDLNYYNYAAMGDFVVREPMVLGHEGAGTVVETGSAVTQLAPGDRVCMEPGIPDPNSRASRLGLYNLDPAVRFWAAPPVHGCLARRIVHPAAYCFKLPENVTLAEGAMVEPLAVALHAANKAGIKAGDTAVVIGAGTIGMLTALAALACGCGRVIITDVLQPKLDLAATLGPITPVNVRDQDLLEVVARQTDGWGAQIVFEASGKPAAAAGILDPLCPGGTVVLVGIPKDAIPLNVAAAQFKEARIETVFRYAHVFDRAVALLSAGKIDVKPLITDVFAFKQGIQAFEHAAKTPPGSVKTQIVFED